MRDAVRELVAAPDADADTFTMLAHVELQVRTLGLVSAAAATTRVHLPNPGSLDRWADFAQTNSSACATCREAASLVLGSVQSQIAPELNLRNVRNTVFHGGPVPTGLDVVELRRIVEANAQAIGQILDHDHVQRLEPFIKEIDGVAYALNSFDEVSATYWPRVGSVVDVVEESLITELRQRVEPGADRLLGAYATDVERDLRGFAETGSARAYVAPEGIVVAHWERRATESSEPRTDYFELSVGGERRWQTPDGARPYPDFLKSISNWSLLKKRLLVGLTDHLDREVRISRELFGEPLPKVAPVQAKVRIIARGSGDDLSETTAISDALDSIVKQTDIYSGTTNLVTLSGEAGSGKTHTLLHFARESLDENENAESTPIVIFISSSGKSAASVPDLIDARVAGTRLLDRASVLALCRSGLAILVIDGVDELLGFRSYDDPLAGLRPVLDELRGRGTVVLSARSSYFEARLRNHSGFQTSMSWPPSVETLELGGWDAHELSQLVETIEGANEMEVAPSHKRLLTTPFFCLAYLGWLQTQSDQSSFLSYVVSRYLLREKAKLIGENGVEMFSVEILESLFCELAEQSAQDHWSDISEQDLLYAGSFATGRELSPFEARRLVALCGMSAERSESTLSFTFTHSALAEYFLALHLYRQPVDRSVSVLSELDLSPLAAELIYTLGRESDQNPMDGMLSAINALSHENRTDHLRASHGSLWTARHAISIEDRTAAGFTAEDVALDGSGLVTVIDCTIRNLTVKGGVRLALQRSQVDHLDISAVDLRAVSGPIWDQALELLTRQELATGSSQIRRLLRPNEGAAETRNTALEQNQYFWAQLRLDSRPVVMAEKSWARDDGRVAWTKEYGEEAWTRFVKELLRDGQATLEPLSTNGKTKVRLRLR